MLDDGWCCSWVLLTCLFVFSCCKFHIESFKTRIHHAKCSARRNQCLCFQFQISFSILRGHVQWYRWRVSISYTSITLRKHLSICPQRQVIVLYGSVNLFLILHSEKCDWLSSKIQSVNAAYCQRDLMKANGTEQ